MRIKQCEVCGFVNESVASLCFTCGNSLPATQAIPPDSLCCPNPKCVKLEYPPSAHFCQVCGSELRPPSYELWDQKYLAPALEDDAVGVLLDPSEVLGAAAVLGLPAYEAEARLDRSSAELTGAGRAVLCKWVSESVEPLRDGDAVDTLASRREVIERAGALNIFPSFAGSVLGRLVPLPEQPEAGVTGLDLPPEEETAEWSADEAPGDVWETPAETDPPHGEESAGPPFVNFLRGGEVSPEPVYLSVAGGSSPEDMLGESRVVLEVNPQGAFVLFRETNGEGDGWVYPNTKLHYRPAALLSVFPTLTEEEFKYLQQGDARGGVNIEPVRVKMLDTSRWQVAGGQNAGAANADGGPTGAAPGERTSDTSPAHAAEDIPPPTPREAFVSSSGFKPAHAAVIASLVIVSALGSWYGWSQRRSVDSTSVLPPPTASPSPATPVPAEGMVLVPGGTFKMGRDGGDQYEKPAHEVTVAPFYIDMFEVTCEEYQRFVDEAKHPAPAGWRNGKYPEGSARLPVEVSWRDADAYARWAGKRLPTEEEWEFAARGTDGRLYPWGKEWKPEAVNAKGTGPGRLTEVGLRRAGASPFGAFDMAGNAWEWTADSIHSYEGGKIAEDGWPASRREAQKVIRGGGYLSNSQQATSTYRSGWPEHGADYAGTGFRCARDVEPPAVRK